MADPVDYKKFLQLISQIESSGGKNTNHPVMQNGIQAGDAAVGSYGLMPNTIKEIINRKRLAGQLSPEYQALIGLPDEQIAARVKANPVLEQNLAGDLSQHVLQKQHGDLDRAAYSWNMGHNLSPDKITPEKLAQSPYVQKFHRVMSMLVPQAQAEERVPASQPVPELKPMPIEEDEDDGTEE